MSTKDSVENKRYKQSSEGAGLQVGGKERNGTSSGTTKTAKSGSFGHRQKEYAEHQEVQAMRGSIPVL